MDKWKRTESSEINPNVFIWTIDFNKVIKTDQGGKFSLFIKWSNWISI